MTPERLARLRALALDDSTTVHEALAAARQYIKGGGGEGDARPYPTAELAELRAMHTEDREKLRAMQIQLNTYERAVEILKARAEAAEAELALHQADPGSIDALALETFLRSARY